VTGSPSYNFIKNVYWTCTAAIWRKRLESRTIVHVHVCINPYSQFPEPRF
jgi:hypothetical protein